MLTYLYLLTLSTSSAYIINHDGYTPYWGSNWTQCLFNLPYTGKCQIWRISSIILLQDGPDIQTKLSAIQEFLLGVTVNCTSTSHYQFFGPGSSQATECIEYEDSSSELQKELTPSMTMVTNISVTGDLLAVKMEELTDCTREQPLKANEAAVVFIFIDIPCYPNINESNFFEKQQALTRQLFNEGFMVRVLYISDDLIDFNCYLQQFDECYHTFPICDIELYGKHNGSMTDCMNTMQTCAANNAAKESGLSTIDIVLLITVPVAFISLVACCCVWSFYRKTVRQMILQAVLNHHSFKETSDKHDAEKANLDDVPTFPSEEMIKKTFSEEDVWQINQEDLEIMDNELLGKGAFARVVKGRLKGKIPLLVVNSSINLVLENLKDGMIDVAVKRLPPHADEQAVIEFLKEIDFMKKLGYHPHIISMIGCIISPVSPLILAEYCYHGDLLTFLRKNRPHVLMSDDEDCPIDAELCLRICDLISFAWQICDGITYLHSKGYVHRDIAARNVLITKSMVAKLSDFGLCRYADSALYVAKGGRLPVKWMAPESLKRFQFSQKSDVWSYGIFLHELFSLGDTPYPTIQPIELLIYLEGGNRMDQPQICPNEVYTLMSNCWEEEASDRPSLDEIGALLRQMLNIEDEYYGYVTLQNPKSVRYMLNREISEFPAAEAKISVSVLNALNLATDSDDDKSDGEYRRRFPSISEAEDYYSVGSRLSSIRTTTIQEPTKSSMNVIPEEILEASESDDMDTWSIATVVGDEPKLEYSDLTSTCRIYPDNLDRTDLIYNAEMADFYR